MRVRIWIATSVLVVAAAAALFVTRAGARADIREITIVGRDMAFYLADDRVANPTLTLRAGERVRLVVRNETRGMVHDLAVDSLGLAVGPLKTGEMATIEFRAPASPGRYEYYCRPHPIMMRGALEVTGH